MSCTCQTSTVAGTVPACRCDGLEPLQSLQIGAGLAHLPLQIAGFPEYRKAMLAAIRRYPALQAWAARQADDPGVMLLEMWAYVCDSLSFYNEVISQEHYLRTARRRPSLRRLVALLGYRPCPAVAGSARLAAFADGTQPVLLPAGTAFRSGGFDENAPQVFELDRDTLIHPLLNKWPIRPPRPGAVPTDNPDHFLVVLHTEIKPGALLLLSDSQVSANTQPVRANHVEPYKGADKLTYNRLSLRQSAGTATRLLAGTPLNRLNLLQAADSAALCTLDTAENAISGDGRKITLNILNRQIKRDDYIIITRGAEARWYRILAIEEVMRTSVPPSTMEVNGSRFQIPGSKMPVSRIELDVSLNMESRKGSGSDWTDAQRHEIRVYFNMNLAATIVEEPKTTLSPYDALLSDTRMEQPPPEISVTRFFLQDRNGRGVLVNGSADFREGRLSKNTGEIWTPDLSLPAEAYGNILEVVRGEQVRGEILGSGNASLLNQSFKLKKKPLTYLYAPTANNDHGVVNTLTVYVDGIQWKEVSSFYGKKTGDQVYIVRQNDESDTFVTFGDGIRGQRLPSGRDNVVAYYRFGAGKASPPAGSINQIVKPVKGLQRVKNPVSADNGGDAESPEAIRWNAPKSALILGRAVSIQDMEAVALTIPGVQTVQAEWRWHGQTQQTAIHIWYIGDANLGKTIYERLVQVSAPFTPFQIEQAKARKLNLVIDVAVDPRYVGSAVIQALENQLLAPGTGVLTPEQLGVGKSVFRSRIFEAVLAVEGITTVRNLYSRELEGPGASLSAGLARRYAITPGAGRYFEISLTLNH